MIARVCVEEQKTNTLQGGDRHLHVSTLSSSAFCRHSCIPLFTLLQGLFPRCPFPISIFLLVSCDTDHRRRRVAWAAQVQLSFAELPENAFRRR